jgi:hypothetical protein
LASGGKGGEEMKMMIVLRYGPSSSANLYTVLEQKYPAALSGGEATGFSVEGSWVALENGAYFLLVDAKDSLQVYDFCYEALHAAEGITVQVIPVMTAKKIEKLPG